jgi:hypothetical protein
LEKRKTHVKAVGQVCSDRPTIQGSNSIGATLW